MDAATKTDLSFDEVVELLKKEVDVTLLDENLKLTPEQRVEKLNSFMELVREAQAAGARLRGES